jgi:hypothetical protein
MNNIVVISKNKEFINYLKDLKIIDDTTLVCPTPDLCFIKGNTVYGDIPYCYAPEANEYYPTPLGFSNADSIDYYLRRYKVIAAS